MCQHCLQPLAATRGAHSSSSQTGAVNILSLQAEREPVILSGDSKGSAARFLQNLVTNDVSSQLIDAQRPSNGRLVYSHILNSKGRFAHDVFLFGLGKESREEDCVVIDVARESKEALIKLLRIYSMRSAVRIQDGSSEYVVCASLNGDMAGGRFAAFCEDPRLGSLGYRGLLPRGDGENASYLEGIASSKEEIAASYTKLRLSLGVAEGPREIPPGTVPLEYNLDGLNGISFNKGCYIGQELMARTHYQGQIRKRLVPFRVVGGSEDARACYDEGVVDDEGNRVGVVRADSIEGYSMAVLRLSKAFTRDGTPVKGLRLEGSGHAVEPYVPSWGPRAWLHMD